MTESGWQTFEGSHHQVGRQLGEYWGRRIHEFARSGDGPFISQMLRNPAPIKEQKALESFFKLTFPQLSQEVEGMVQGAKDAGHNAACFSGLFRIVLGEVEDSIGCSSIAMRGEHANFLSHNEEESTIDPLCYARVRVRRERTVREFLSISYPFQLFGSAAGANANIAFIGNSIGMRHKRRDPVRRTLRRRVPKTVLTRLMLECQSITTIKRTLRAHPALLPSHWFVASDSEIVSIQMRPRATRRLPEKQVHVSRVTTATCCHTNHFQSGDTEGWSNSKKKERRSKSRLEQLREIAGGLGVVREPPEAELARLQGTLKESRAKLGGEEETLATIAFAVDKEGSTATAYDYFSGKSIGTARVGR